VSAAIQTSRPDTVAAVRRDRRARRRRAGIVTAVLALIALAVFVLSLVHGDVDVPLGDVLGVLTGGGDPASRFIVGDLRLPRAETALLVGFGLGLSGAVFQNLLRNPLASPDVIGITQGASAAAVLASLVFGASGLGLSLAALAGSLLTAALMYALAWRRGVHGGRLVLTGIGVGAGLTSVTSYLMTTSQTTQAQSALVWLTGSLNGTGSGQLQPLLWAMAVLVPLTLLAARALGILGFGEEVAAGLGVRVQRSQLALLACAVALAGVATAAAGPVAFVAFVSGPIARRLVRGRSAALLPSALTGAALVTAADFTAQHLLWSDQLPVGVVTSLIGAPYLLWLLARANRSGAL
jgi:iron complex transport system permease protein